MKYFKEIVTSELYSDVTTDGMAIAEVLRADKYDPTEYLYHGVAGEENIRRLEERGHNNLSETTSCMVIVRSGKVYVLDRFSPDDEGVIDYAMPEPGAIAVYRRDKFNPQVVSSGRIPYGYIIKEGENFKEALVGIIPVVARRTKPR